MLSYLLLWSALTSMHMSSETKSAVWDKTGPSSAVAQEAGSQVIAMQQLASPWLAEAEGTGLILAHFTTVNGQRTYTDNLFWHLQLSRFACTRL